MTGSDLGKVGQEQPASLPLLLLLLTVTTGLIDAVSVLGLGRVFTANMTGNVVFLGFALARVPGFSLVRSLAALAAFLAGAVIGGRLAIRLEGSRGRWLATVAAVESSLLFAAALAAIGYDAERLAACRERRNHAARDADLCGPSCSTVYPLMVSFDHACADY